jgi:DNA-binding NarL/FixJ family response regulator
MGLSPHTAAPIQPSKSTKSILVVDDHPSTRAVIRAAIEEFTKYRICGEASDGTIGIKKALTLRPDLVVMDARLPSMNGLEAAKIIKNYLPKLPIILFTMYADSLNGSSGTFGVNVVPKSDGVTALLQRMRSLLEPVDTGSQETQF